MALQLLSAAAAQQICSAQTLLEILYIIVTKSGAAACRHCVSKCRIQYRILLVMHTNSFQMPKILDSSRFLLTKKLMWMTGKSATLPFAYPFFQARMFCLLFSAE